ncbi:Ankyrin repeat-containing domain [Trinorchestia longiramus]|nr:Ankyrin repeat-containing domain [Trinorchestia longiramus]
MTADINEVVAQIRKGDKIGLLVYLHHGGDANARNSMGWTLLHIACFEGKTEIVEILLDNGAQVNACTTDMATPLHRASSQGCRGAVAALLNKNAYVNAQDKNGNTALHEAARGAYTSIVKALINQKADKEKLNNRKQKFTDLVGQQLMPAVASGDTETLALWLDWGLSPNTCGSLGWSLLHHASVSGQAEVAALLIDRGANLETLDSNKSSALHAASFHGSKDIVKLLLKNGANPNLQDQRGNTPLHSAVSGSHAEIINLLLEGGADTSIANHENMVFKHIVKDVLVKTVHEGKTSQVTALLKGHADPDTRDAFGTPLICVAAFNKDLLIVDALLEAGADPNLSSTDSKKTALHYAAFWDDLFIIKSLLDRKAKIDPVDRFGNTPLHEAASEGHVDVITMLTGRLAAINTPNLDGNTPLHLAAKAGETAAVELLLEKTANESFLNKNGQLYSDLALINAVRTEMPDKVMAGLAWGGDPNTKDQKGWTLLHHAVFKGSLEITSMLLECGAEVDEVDIHGRTALIVAAYRGNCAIASRLIDAGANMERQDLEGQTALHWAAREGSVETVLCLIDHGADTAIKDNAGRFFKHWLVKHLYLAVRHTDPEKVEALLSAGADQFTRVEGTDVTPREEAKRRKSFSILKLMVARSQLTHTYEEEFDFWNMPAIEDLRVLFKGEDSSDEDSEEEAEWKMKNAEVVVSAKELFADDNNELWEVWDEKPKWITSKELCQEDVQDFWQSWEETSEKPRQRSRSPPPPARSNDDSETESDEETDESGNSNEDEVRKPLEELQQDAEGKFFFAIPAKEIFKEDSSWLDEFDDSKYSSSKAIPAREAFKEDDSWLESDDEEEYKPSKAIPAKEAFKEDYSWLNNNEDFTFKQSNAIPLQDAFKEDDSWLNSDDEVEYEPTKTIRKEEACKEDDSLSDSDGDSTLATALPDKEIFKEYESLLNSDDESGDSLPNVIGAQEAFKEDDSWLNSEESESAQACLSDDGDTESCDINQFKKTVTDETSWMEEEDDSGYSSTKITLPKEHSEVLSQNPNGSTPHEICHSICPIDNFKNNLTCSLSALGEQDSGDNEGWKKDSEVSELVEKLDISSFGIGKDENDDSLCSSDESITDTKVSRDSGDTSAESKCEGEASVSRIRKNWDDTRDSMMTDKSSQKSDSSRHLPHRSRIRSNGKNSDLINGSDTHTTAILNPVMEVGSLAAMQQNCSEVDLHGIMEDNQDKTPKSFSECFGFAFGRPIMKEHNDTSLVTRTTNSNTPLLYGGRKNSVIAYNTNLSDALAYSLSNEDCFKSEDTSYMNDMIHGRFPIVEKGLQYTPFYKVPSKKEKIRFATTFTTSKDGLLSLNSDYNSTPSGNVGIPRCLPEFKTGGFGSFRFSELMTRDENDYKQLERTEGLSSSNVDSCSQVCLLSEPEVVQRVLVRMPAALDSSLEESGECEPIVEEYKDALASDDHKNSLDIPSAVTRLTSTEAIDESPINVFEVNDRNDRIDETFHHCESEVIRNTQLLQNDHSMQNKDLQNVLMKDDVTDFSPCYSDNGKKDNEQHLISKTPTASSFSGFQTRKSCSPLPETQESLTSRENTSSLAQNFASLPELKTFLYSSLDVDKILEPEVKSVRETCLVKCRALLSQNKPNNEVVDEQENSHRSNLSPTSETHTVAFTDSEAVSVPKNKLKEEENKFKNDSPLNPQFSLEDVDDAGHALLPSTSVTQGDSYGIDEVQPTPDFSETEIAVVVPEEDTHREMKPKPKNSSDDGKDSALMSFISFCVFILFITSYLLLKWFT